MFTIRIPGRVCFFTPANCHQPETWAVGHPCNPLVTPCNPIHPRGKRAKRKDSAGSDDTASMIKGGGYLGARTRQKIQKEINVGQGGCVP